MKNTLHKLMKKSGVTEKEIKRVADKKVIPEIYEGDHYLLVKGAAGGYFGTVWYESGKVSAHVNAQITVEIIKNVSKKLDFSCIQIIDTFYTKKLRKEEEIVLKIEKDFYDLIVLYREEKVLQYKIDRLLNSVKKNGLKLVG